MNGLHRTAVAALCLAAVAGPAWTQTYSDVTPGAAGVTASTSDTNVPANAVDGSLDTRWSANGDGQWLQIDLGTARTIGYVRVAVYSGNTRTSAFELQVSNGGGIWSTVWSGSSSGSTTGLETYDFGDVEARWVRYLGHGNSVNTWNSVTEIEIWASGGTTPPPTPTPTPTATPSSGFRHPGVLNSRASLDFVKARIAAGEAPWKPAFDELSAHPLASLTREPRPWAVVECGSFSNPDFGCTDETADAQAAYAQALLWYFTGNPLRAQKAIQYMNAWSAVLTDHTNSNAPLQAAWAALNWTKAAEIIRHTGAGWSATDVERFRALLIDVYYPETRNGSGGNGNWELSMIDANIGIGVFTDNRTIFDAAVTMWRGRTPAYIYITSDGATPKAPPGRSRPNWYGATYVEGVAQETCRDLEHTSYGLAAIAYTAETARVQGVDLYGAESRRIRAGYEYNLRLQSGWSGNGQCGGTVHRNLKEIGEVAMNQYQTRLGLAMPYTQAYVTSVRPTAPTWYAVVWETITHAAIGAPQ
jgi:F5/8 type C domain-containing protein/alginate lyase